MGIEATGTVEQPSSPARSAQTPDAGHAALCAAGRTVAWLARQVELGLAAVELTLPQYRVLGLLQEGSAVASAVAHRLAVRPPSVTAVVDGLVARGLVRRRHMEADRRCVALALTPAGAAVLAQANRAVEERMASLLGELEDDHQATVAVHGLEAWRQALVARATATAAR